MDNRREEVENKIIAAATKVFIAKGFKGATMRDIAAESDINLAMLNYYFRTKENLFDIIFERAFGLIYGQLFRVLASEKSLFDKIRSLVSAYMEVLISNPTLPSFIFSEIALNPERLSDKLKGNKQAELIFTKFQEQIDNEVNVGKIKPISFMELYMNIDSLCTFPFIAQPMFREIFNISEINFGALLERRKLSVAELLIDGLKS